LKGTGQSAGKTGNIKTFYLDGTFKVKDSLQHRSNIHNFRSK